MGDKMPPCGTLTAQALGDEYNGEKYKFCLAIKN